MLVDIHCHLEHHDFEKDIDSVIDNAKKAGLSAIISCGVNPETNRKTLELAKRFPIIKPALGIYPPDALRREIASGGFPSKEKDFSAKEEIAFIESKKRSIIAVSEIGLDYQDPASDKEMQKKVFTDILEMAQRIKRPVVIHTRKAESDVLDILESFDKLKIVLHCFSGKMKLVERAAEKRYSFSIPTNVVRSEHFQQVVKAVNINQLLTETDSPYLSPYPGKRNEPAFVIESVKKIAEIKSFNLEEVKNNIFMNYQRMFEMN